MIPASFAPMILKLILPKVSDHLMKVFKLDRLLRYMEEDNETDLEVKKHKEHINMLAGNMSALEDRLKKLEILYGKPKKLKSK